ncbi:hypothetical protein HDU76_009822, partial [Blyttiomyces sp. JEL0837]
MMGRFGVAMLSFALWMALLAKALPTKLLDSCQKQHNITVLINVDNQFTLYMPGGPDPIIGENDWGTTQIFTSIVSGPGPHLVAVDAVDYGVVSGIAMIVLVDGELYTATGLPDSHVKIYAGAYKGPDTLTRDIDTEYWATDVAMPEPEAVWAVGVEQVCSTRNVERWGGVEKKLAAASGFPGLPVKMVWWPSCDSMNIRNFLRLKVVPPECTSLNSEVTSVAKSNVLNIERRDLVKAASLKKRDDSSSTTCEGNHKITLMVSTSNSYT